MKKGYIYKITNKINGKFYIGKTTNMIKRMSSHKCDRRRHTYLTKAIDKYGWENFTYEIIWEGDREQLNEVEKTFIKKYNAFKDRNVYNCTIGGDGGVKGKDNPLYGRKRPEEVKKKISESKKKNYHPLRGKKMPEWWKNKIERRNGENHHNAKEWIITSPEGKEYKIKSLLKFCKENNLNDTLMRKVAKGKRNHHKGWKCMEVMPL